MPEEAENKEVSWNSVNEAVVSVSGNGLVTVLPEAAWIKALEKVDADNLARDKYYVSTAAGTMETSIQVLTLDGQKSAECKVVVAFKQQIRHSGHQAVHRVEVPPVVVAVPAVLS